MATFSTDGPNCPYCGWQCTPDEASYYDETGYELECGEAECAKKFTVQPHCSWSWVTREMPSPLAHLYQDDTL